MRRNDLAFVWNCKLVEGGGSVPHRLPIGAASHDDADERLRHRPALMQL
jgi:hypothetical protein